MQLSPGHFFGETVKHSDGLLAMVEQPLNLIRAPKAFEALHSKYLACRVRAEYNSF